jgi:hypothetical protein
VSAELDLHGREVEGHLMEFQGHASFSQVGGHDAREETDDVALEDHDRAEGIGGDDRRDVARAPYLL